MNFEIFVLGLLAISTLTGLATEGVKVLLKEWGKSYKANTLAGIIAVVISVTVGVSYAIIASVTINATFIIYLVGLVFLSWLCAMVGYDKVIQAISQFKTSKGGNL